jgi:ABC-2 type transport system permease protein
VILVILRVMALGVWRDRAGLVMTFALPPLVFIVFASVFAAGASGKLDVKAGVFDQARSAQSRRLIAALNDPLGGRLNVYPNRAALLEALADGRVDAGLALTGDLSVDPTPVTVLIHPGRRAAGEVLTAQVKAVAERALPDVMTAREMARLGPLLALSARQRARLSGPGPAPAPPTPFVGQQVLSGGDPIVIYYAGAVSILFLLFTAMQGAMSLIDERRAGLRLRLGLSAGGVAPLLLGRMLWLTALGVAQALVLFVVAAILYRIPLIQSLLPWTVTALAAAAASGGIALALAAACPTREQAQTLSTFVVLILAAVGGSMAPRFLMPAPLQALGWLTPHAWVIDAYQTILWRRIVDARVLAAWAVLAAFAGVGFVIAWTLERRRRL